MMPVCSISGVLGFGGDQFVDFRAKIFHDEIFFGGRIAVIDLLGPAFQRDFDAEFLVDSKNNVEEVEAVDAQIVNGMALRRDIFYRDFTGIRDNLRDFVECIRHLYSSSMFQALAVLTMSLFNSKAAKQTNYKIM